MSPEQSALLRNTFLESASIPVIMCDSMFFITAANPAASRLLPALKPGENFNRLINRPVLEGLRSTRLLPDLLGYPALISPLSEKGDEPDAYLIQFPQAAGAKTSQPDLSACLAALSHEFNTPLTLITTALSNIQRVNAGQNEKISLYTGIGLKSTHWLTRQTRHFLALSHLIKAPDEQFEAHCIDIVPVIEQLCTQVIDMPSMDIAPLVFEKNCASCPLKCYPFLLELTLLNLISNSFKYNRNKHPVKIILNQTDERVIITVSDKGIGMDAHTRKWLFEPFYRSDNTLRLPGAGVGLTIVKGCVEHIGGSITVKSRPGRGTDIILSFPPAASQAVRQDPYDNSHLRLLALTELSDFLNY